MKGIDVSRIAVGNLKRNRLRTFLTVSGVVVGIGAIVFLVSLGFGMQKLAIEKIVQLEALKVVTVTADSKTDTKIDDEFVNKMKKSSDVSAVSPIVRSVAKFSVNGAETEQVIFGVNPDMMELENLKVSDGNNIKDAHDVIVSKEVVRSLGLQTEEIIGKESEFEIRNESGSKKVTLKITGVIDEKGIYAPFDTLKNGSKNYALAKVKVSTKEQIAPVKKMIESMGYNTSVIKDQSQSVNMVFTVIKVILGGFGMIALFVAAIGIFNTMTISLLERTHEIGVMKAIGGQDWDIASIFITESALIGLMGGIFGLASGWIGGFIVNTLVNFMATELGGEAVPLFYIPPSFAIATVVFSFLISTIAGIWPAKRAAKLNPLEALRYE